MAVRAFDVVGTLAVVGWLVVTGLFVHRTECRNTSSTASLDSTSIAMEEGESWMLLRRQGDEIGYLHRTHTRLDQGWLIEYDMLVILELIGRKIPLRTEVKSTLDGEGYLVDAHAAVDVANRHIDARAQIDGREATLIIDAGENEPMHRTMTFQTRPRLASNAVHQLMASDDLQPGDTFEQTYFDPTSLGQQSILMRYKGRESIEVFDRNVEAHFIRQEIAGRELDVYVDDRGQILVQEFPMKVVGARVRPELGKTRASKLRTEAHALRKKLDRNGGGLGKGLEMALDLVGLGGGSQMMPDFGDGSGGTDPPRDAASRSPETGETSPLDTDDASGTDGRPR